jgi:hypothetical protein
MRIVCEPAQNLSPNLWRDKPCLEETRGRSEPLYSVALTGRIRRVPEPRAKALG